MEQKRMNSTEQLEHISIIGCIRTLKDVEPRISGRLDGIKKSRFWLRGAIKSLEQLSDALDATVPDHQHETLRRQLGTLCVSIGVKNAGNGRDTTYGRWLSFKDLDLVGEVLKEHCMMCTKDIQQQRACRFAKLMDTLPMDQPNPNSAGCKWFAL